MSQCIYLQPDGTVTATTESPSVCAGFVLLTREEYQEAINPLFRPLSIEAGVTITIAIISLWSLAFVYRAIRSFLSNPNGDA